ncbi:hypothetical protein DFP73DRAFT_515463 [Morchella snyderi]|nr:hypothetical protein DFP73DRAFT_515463 [Morchella snyderi]
MSLYYVYTRYQPTTPIDVGAMRRYLLTCASRDHANAFYRHFHSRLRFVRVSAQFWEYDPVNPNLAMLQTLTDPTIPDEIRRGVLISRLHETDNIGGWIQVPAQAGRDWISGRAYFIRNVRQPELYWYQPGHGDERVLASRWQKTKFIVRLSDAPEGETGTVLIKSDKVRLTAAEGDGKGMVVRRGDEGRVMVVRPSAAELASTAGDFTFGELEGGFGTEWVGPEGEGPAVGVPCECVTWGNRAEMHLDDWELC